MTDTPGPTAANESRIELDRLRQRVAWYESFDARIQESVAQAGQLLREAADIRESASASAIETGRTLDALRESDFQRYRSLFSSLLDEITDVQGHAERIARRLADAIDALEAELPSSEEFPPLPASGFPALTRQVNLTAQTASPAESQAECGQQHPAIEPSETVLAESSKPETTESAAQKSSPSEATLQPSEYEWLRADQSSRANDHPGDANAVSVSPPAHPERLATENQDQPGPFILLVHGVPRAATALSLKTYLEGLDAVRVVEPREFAAGVLRLQLDVNRSLTINDLLGWPEGRNLTPLHARDGMIEVQMA